MIFLRRLATRWWSGRDRVIVLISACLLSPSIQAEVQVVPGKTTPIASPNDNYCQADPPGPVYVFPNIFRFAECTATNQNSSLQLRAEVCCSFGFNETVTSEGKLFYDFEIKNLAGDRPDVLTTSADFTVKLDGLLISFGLPEITSGLELHAKIVDRETNTDAFQLTEIDRTNADLNIGGVLEAVSFLYSFAQRITYETVFGPIPDVATVVRVTDRSIPVTISAPLRAGGHYRLEIDAKCRAKLIGLAPGVAYCDFSPWAGGQIVVSPISITVAEQPPGAADLINIITSPLLMDDDPDDVKNKRGRRD